MFHNSKVTIWVCRVFRTDKYKTVDYICILFIKDKKHIPFSTFQEACSATQIIKIFKRVTLEVNNSCTETTAFLKINEPV